MPRFCCAKIKTKKKKKKHFWKRSGMFRDLISFDSSRLAAPSFFIFLYKCVIFQSAGKDCGFLPLGGLLRSPTCYSGTHPASHSQSCIDISGNKYISVPSVSPFLLSSLIPFFQVHFLSGFICSGGVFETYFPPSLTRFRHLSSPGTAGAYRQSALFFQPLPFPLSSFIPLSLLFVFPPLRLVTCRPQRGSSPLRV